jgi:alkylated DNA repair dioxygenase AlkB
MDLFSDRQTLTPIPIADGILAFQPQLALPLPNAEILTRLIDETPWKAEHITLWGKQFLQPRLTAWQGEKGYTYSGLSLSPLPFSALVLDIKAAVEAACGVPFNSVLLNYYRDGRDSMGMHSDDEPELGPEPAIASVSFGAARTFILQHKVSTQREKLVLTDGSLLFMAGMLQRHWSHGINKSARPTAPRVNLTFRFIV